MSISTDGLNKVELNLEGAWRERFLQRILFLSAVVGLFTLIPAVLGTSDLILQTVYISVFVLLVTVIVIRFSYSVKAAVFSFLLLILGLGSITETGIRGDSLFFFLAFVTFSSLLINPRAGVISMIIAEFITVLMGYLILTGRYTLSDTLTFEGDLFEWVIAATSLLLVSLATITALRLLNESIQKTQEYAAAVQQSQLVSQKELEDRVLKRTQELSRKAHLLNASSVVTHQISVLQNMETLMNRTVNLISEHFACYHAGIYLINQRGDYVTLQAASSAGGKRLLEEGFRLKVGTDGIIGFVAAEKKPRIALDVDEDAVFLGNSELAETRSELSLPLSVNNEVIGVLDIQSAEANAFRYDEVEIFQGMADQIAVSIENTRLLAESHLVISQLETLSNENTRQNWKYETATRHPIFHYSATGIHPVGKSAFQRQKATNALEIPIVLRGQKIGNILLQRKAGFQKWTAQEEFIANEVASQTALALENIRLVERTRERANREQVIADVSARIRETLDLDIVLRTSAREIQKALNLQEAEIRLIPPNSLDDDESRGEALF